MLSVPSISPIQKAYLRGSVIYSRVRTYEREQRIRHFTLHAGESGPKEDQRSGALTEGVVRDLLTKSSYHPHGIKVRLEDWIVGRVKEILEKGA
jgi:uncharacterized repeat protein (TIGR03833 family)